MKLERQPGEGTIIAYRRRVSKMIPRRGAKQGRKVSKDDARNTFRENCHDLIIEAYHGFVAEKGELVTGYIGIHMDPAAVEFRNGENALEDAYHFTYGRPMTGQDFLDEVRMTLIREHGRNGLRIIKLPDFLRHVEKKIQEIRQKDQQRSA